MGGETVDRKRPLTLRRYLADGETLDTESPQPQPAVLTGSRDVWGPYTWQGQPRFYCDEHDNRYEYVYKVTEAQITLEPGAGSFTTAYNFVDDVHIFTNTYVPPAGDYYMKKAWNGGKPRDITVQLQRKYVGEDDIPTFPWGGSHPRRSSDAESTANSATRKIGELGTPPAFLPGQMTRDAAISTVLSADRHEPVRFHLQCQLQC